jgi:hypothetical protein
MRPPAPSRLQPRPRRTAWVVLAAVLTLGCLSPGGLVAPDRALADRSYAEDPVDFRGADLTVLRLSDDGRRLTFLSAHVRLRRLRPRYPNGEAQLAAGEIRNGRLAARLRLTIRYQDGTQTINALLRLRGITTRQLRGSWTAEGVLDPVSGRSERCRARIPFVANRGWYVGETSAQHPVAVNPQGSSVFPVIAYRADCTNLVFLRPLYAAPMAVDAQGDFGWTTPIDFTGAGSGMLPAKLVASGRLSRNTAAGTFSMAMDNEGVPCTTGFLTWNAVRG